LAEYEQQSLRIRREMMETMAMTEETIAVSRALMAETDAVIARW
jgi:hypothetical protein